MSAYRPAARRWRRARCANQCARCWPGGTAPWHAAGIGRDGRSCSLRWQPAATAGPYRTVLPSRIAARSPREATAIIFACTGQAVGQPRAADPFRSGFPVSGSALAALYYREEGSPCAAAGGGPAAYGGAGLDATWWRGHGAEPYGGRCIMSRSGVFYVVKAMERTVAGTAAADAPPVPARPAADRGAAAAARPDGRTSSLVRRLLTAVQHRIGRAPGATGRGRRRLGGAARAD